MAKKFFRSLTLGVIVFAVAVLVGYLSYVITYHYQTQKLRESVLLQDSAAAAPVFQDAQPVTDDQPIRVDHYIARLENKDIAIYMVAEGQEFFLYNLNIYTGNLPAADLLRLQEGVVLQNRKDLASFEEDYTS